VPLRNKPPVLPPPLKLPSDEPTLDDQLGRAALVREVGDAVAFCEPPQVIGIHGDWGVGKTSFLQQLQWFLSGECPQSSQPTCTIKLGKEHKARTTVVWFEAWRYQNEPAPIVALLQEIRTQLPWYSKALNEARKLGDVTIRGALLSMEDLTKRIGIQASKIEGAGRQWEDENLATRLPSHTIRVHLEEAMRQLLGRGKDENHRLVVLIDDLDRCSSETAYNLLEGIKIYLNLPSCVFVLGMNQAVVEQAIARQMPRPEVQWDERRSMAREYMEKLCQNVWHLPLLDEPADFLHHSLGEGFPGRDALREVVRRHRCLPPIPRKVKGYASVLLRSREHVAARQAQGLPADGDRWAELVVLFTYLYHFQQHLYRLLAFHGQPFYQELLDWCRGRSTVGKERFATLRRQREPEPAGVEEQREAVPMPRLRYGLYDPVSEDVFHIQTLVDHLGAVTDPEIQDHLLHLPVKTSP
jgi:hypothetical protein